MLSQGQMILNTELFFSYTGRQLQVEKLFNPKLDGVENTPAFRNGILRM